MFFDRRLPLNLHLYKHFKCGDNALVELLARGAAEKKTKQENLDKTTV